MAEADQKPAASDPPSQAQPPASQPDPSPSPPPPHPFDPSRMIGIIKRKALIKELAALYHAECLAYCQELLELQKKWEEVRMVPFYFIFSILLCAVQPFVDTKTPDDTRKEIMKPPKRLKKTR
ncbi:hypothetical protein JRO89_XS06G0013100 [Xanthoceras sorbifolium]|uniref:Uncharacterized protein n=1 Tax=Xanthoceras sorbifolium TaxID=99658 RepID=A0ABQ8HW25_9ROSI|nr:hypothetical protein JRO89_XS06G0013100 [Xanthoceras sorbifolium]